MVACCVRSPRIWLRGDVGGRAILIVAVARTGGKTSGTIPRGSSRECDWTNVQAPEMEWGHCTHTAQDTTINRRIQGDKVKRPTESCKTSLK